MLDILPALVGRVVIPPAVLHEIEQGKAAGIDLPDIRSLEWLTIRHPARISMMPFEHDLGSGEIEVLTLAGEMDEVVVVLDDGLARKVAELRRIAVIGTLGVLLNAKRAGLVSNIKELLDRLQAKRFRLSPVTRTAVLKLAGEQE